MASQSAETRFEVFAPQLSEKQVHRGTNCTVTSEGVLMIFDAKKMVAAYSAGHWSRVVESGNRVESE